jgi:DNA primase
VAGDLVDDLEADTMNIESVEDVLTAIGIEQMSSHGNNITARCPVHYDETGEVQRERTRTWRINSETGLWYCHSCKARGNLQILVRRVTGGELDDADITHFVVRQSVKRAEQRQATKEGLIKAAPVRVDEGAFQAYDYVPTRHLHDREISSRAAEELELRWDPDERSWIIPIRDPETFAVWGWQEKLPNRQVLNWPVGVEKSKTLFGIERCFRGMHSLVVVESPLDVARLLTIDIPAVSTFGAATSDAQIELIEALRPKVLVDGYDNDSAGRSAGRELRRRYRRRCLRMYYEHTRAKDPGDMSDYEVFEAVRKAYSPFAGSFR